MVTGGLHTIDDARGSGRVVSVVDPAACAPIDTMGVSAYPPKKVQ